jgi:flagellar hook protein FlgE
LFDGYRVLKRTNTPFKTSQSKSDAAGQKSYSCEKEFTTYSPKRHRLEVNITKSKDGKKTELKLWQASVQRANAVGRDPKAIHHQAHPPISPMTPASRPAGIGFIVVVGSGVSLPIPPLLDVICGLMYERRDTLDRFAQFRKIMDGQP